MADAANLWQLRADCLRSFGTYFSEAREGQVGVTALAGQDYRLPRSKTLKGTSWGGGPSDTSCEDGEPERTARNAA